MYVREIRIKKFRHLENVTFGPFPCPPAQSDLVVLAGPNGGGKSSVLELLGYALSNSWSLGWQIRRSFPTSSFEVAIAMTAGELDLLRENVKATPFPQAEEVFKYLQAERTYYRAFNFPEGEYNKNQQLQNRTHELVTRTLRNHHKRALGFFLRSDRSYPQQGFQRDRLFQYDQMNRLDHVWSMAFNTSDVQYQDMFDYLAQQRYHYFRRLGAFHHRRGLEQIGTAEQAPSDPLRPYDELLQRLFPGYGFAEGKEEVPSNLFVRLASGDEVPFTDLSSGEKEVFFILSFFLRHDVSNAIIAVDEPELHLHPEFARLLIRTMQAVKPGNQIWVATHNPEVIDEAGRDKTIYITRDVANRTVQALPATDEAQAIRALRDLFGYSGYIGIAKTMVFLEGTGASADRKLLTRLFPKHAGLLKFVPAGGCESLPRLNAAILSILESTVSWCNFYLIRDRDYLTAPFVQKYANHASGRLYVLNRHQIENYLLHDDVIATVQGEIFGRPTTAVQVKEQLSAVARSFAGAVLREMISFRLNLVFCPQGFSLGKMLGGQNVLLPSGEWDNGPIESLQKAVQERVRGAIGSVAQSGSDAEVARIIQASQDEIRTAILGDGWRETFPGRLLLEEYARATGLGKPPAFQNSLIKALGDSPDRLPEELRHVMNTIIEGKSLVSSSVSAPAQATS